MTYKEFTIEIAPMVLELQNECRKMTEDEFEDFRQQLLPEVRKTDGELCKKFMGAILDMVHKNIFETPAVKHQKIDLRQQDKAI